MKSNPLIIEIICTFMLAGILGVLMFAAPSFAQSANCSRKMVSNACADHTRQECGTYMYPSRSGCRCDGAHKVYKQFVPCYWDDQNKTCLADFRIEPWQGRCPIEVNSSALVAVVQLASEKAGDFAAMTDLAKQAKRRGAELVIFPESSAFGWLSPRVFTDAHPIPGKTAASFASIARAADIWVAAGLAERGPAIKTPPGSGAVAYEAYDSGVLINPNGEIVLHHRKYAVLKNAFNPKDCPAGLGTGGCSYTPGPLSDIKIAETPFGRTALLVCADAYTYDKTALLALKALKPEFVIIPWGVAAGTQKECGTEFFNATEFAAKAAKVLATAHVVGANAVGPRPYGRFLPSVYCGTSGFATPAGKIGGVADTHQELAIFDIPVNRP